VALDSANFPAQIRTSEVANEEARSVLLMFFRKAMIKGTCGRETKGKATGKVRDQTHLKWCVVEKTMKRPIVIVREKIADARVMTA
jgi:hypothetical protein